MKITVLYIGTSLLSPLRKAEAEINKLYSLGLRVAAHNCGAPLTTLEWEAAARDISESEIVFVIHVTDSDNANRITSALDSLGETHTVIAFNCMPDLMRRTRMGRLDFGRLMDSRESREQQSERASKNLLKRVGYWMAEQVKSRSARDHSRAHNGNGKQSHGGAGAYLKLVNRLPSILRFVPGTGRLKDVKNYLYLFCYFLQPTPKNVQSMLLYAIKNYGEKEFARLKIDAPQSVPVAGIYHPDAPELFPTFDSYKKWYERSQRGSLDCRETIGLLLMRPQVVSASRGHYDGLIRAIESEGLSVVPALSTFMDNRDACREFFIDPTSAEEKGRPLSRVSQIVSLTGFSFVGGPAMNDAEASVEFLREIGVPYRSLVSLDVQTIENWGQSKTGLNPIQTAMQIAIPEIDGASEPFIFGGLSEQGDQPEPIEERCLRIARRIKRWNHLRVAPKDSIKLAFSVFCFPPNKGNIGTAADLDVFASLMETLIRLKAEGYDVTVPESAERLREILLKGNSEEFGQVANVAYRMGVAEYRELCPYVREIEREWGRAPGLLNSDGRDIFILGVELGNVFVGIQPTFGYEGDPMRLLAAESASPHHGFMGFYTYIEKIFRADAVVHVGTHGALEFMPGKQAGLSSRCWPDRLVGELPNIYIYSVNNPSEGTIAKRRSYAELVSYLTPPIEQAGLYKELSSLKELLSSYRRSTSETEREYLFEAIEEKARELNLKPGS
ncbi:MAG TPA: cobaltochelatase subunit CobN [Blastocatellia bacterium]|nr:cobaltochelatase subunit CobN [Blastocatellia bacterium]